MISCGISNESEKNQALKDEGLHYINIQNWEKAISIFLSLLKEDKSPEYRYYLALSYAGCSKYSLIGFHDRLSVYMKEYFNKKNIG